MTRVLFDEMNDWFYCKLWQGAKHNLPVNKGLQPLASQMVTSLSKLFEQKQTMRARSEI